MISCLVNPFKVECDKLTEQNESLKSNQVNLNSQFESRIKELTALKEASSNLEEKSQTQDLEV